MPRSRTLSVIARAQRIPRAAHRRVVILEQLAPAGVAELDRLLRRVDDEEVPAGTS
jgi:hypothetical protein